MSLAILIVTVIAVFLLIKSRKEYRISYNLTLYQTGAALYIFNNYEKAASVLCKALNQSVTEDNEDLKAKVLYGLCMWEYSQITSDNVMMREAVLNLKTLHESKTYAELKTMVLKRWYMFPAQSLSLQYIEPASRPCFLKICPLLSVFFCRL